MSDDILTTTAQEIMVLVDELVLDPRVMIRHTLERFLPAAQLSL